MLVHLCAPLPVTHRINFDGIFLRFLRVSQVLFSSRIAVFQQLVRDFFAGFTAAAAVRYPRLFCKLLVSAKREEKASKKIN